MFPPTSIVQLLTSFLLKYITLSDDTDGPAHKTKMPYIIIWRKQVHFITNQQLAGLISTCNKSKYGLVLLAISSFLVTCASPISLAFLTGRHGNSDGVAGADKINEQR